MFTLLFPGSPGRLSVIFKFFTNHLLEEKNRLFRLLAERRDFLFHKSSDPVPCKVNLGGSGAQCSLDLIHGPSLDCAEMEDLEASGGDLVADALEGAVEQVGFPFRLPHGIEIVLGVGEFLDGCDLSGLGFR